MKNFDSFCNACERVGYFDSADYKDGVYTLSQGNKSLQMMRKGNEVLLWSRSNPASLKKVIGSGVEKVLPRLVVSFFTGLRDASFQDPDTNNVIRYKDVGIFPSRVVSGKVEFSDHAGRKWICQSSNAPNVTLGFYSICYDGNADMSALMLPMLKRRDSVKVFSSAGSREEDGENVAVVSSVEDFERSVPNLRDYFMFPKIESVPSYGTAVVSGLAVSSADRWFVSQANTKTAQFLSSKAAHPVHSGSTSRTGNRLSSGVNYKVYSYDLLGNDEDGYEVNDVSYSGITIDVEENDSDAVVLQKLKDVGYIKNHVGSITGDGEFGDILYFDYEGYPAFELRPVNSSVDPGSSRRIQSGRVNPDFRGIVSSAEIMRLKLDESGVFHLDMGHTKDGHEIYSSLRGVCDAGQLIAISKKAGFSYSDITSGVDFTGSSVLPEFKKFLAASASFKPVADPAIKRSVAAWVISGRELDKELSKWGLNNPGKIFSAVEVLGVDLDGKSNFKVPVGSSDSLDSIPDRSKFEFEQKKEANRHAEAMARGGVNSNLEEEYRNGPEEGSNNGQPVKPSLVGKEVVVDLGKDYGGAPESHGVIIAHRPHTGRIKVLFDDGYEGVFEESDPKVGVQSVDSFSQDEMDAYQERRLGIQNPSRAGSARTMRTGA
jgi:hypothetical protein